ncbi:MAG: ATP-binding cassette domain-containing protein [Chitinophagales bacterium]|nr:ATP-binding cassette domain-containing protein [Chitinophagales bacterium]
MREELLQERQKRFSTKDQSVVNAKDLKKSFGEKQVLNGLDFYLNDAENVVILGKSGSGKSVFIKCIVGLLKPDEGKLQLWGKDVNEMGPKDWEQIRRKIGFLFQGGALYDSMSVRENMEFPVKRQLQEVSQSELNEMVEEALDSVGLLDAIDKMPAELSGGMQKRMSLARTLILKPEIILYDEPTTGLDPVTSREISLLIREMQEKHKISSIIITHDMPCARITSDRMYVLKEGKFTAEGTFETLQNTDDKWVKDFFI